MAKYDKVDLGLSEDGDLILSDGDFLLAQNQGYVIQSVRNRIRTSDPEWIDYIETDIGANMEDLRGLPNTPETAQLGAQAIGKALTRDGLIDGEDIYIKPTPISKDVLIFFVFINLENNGQPIGFEVSLNLHSGIEIRSV